MALDLEAAAPTDRTAAALASEYMMWKNAVVYRELIPIVSHHVASAQRYALQLFGGVYREKGPRCCAVLRALLPKASRVVANKRPTSSIVRP